MLILVLPEIPSISWSKKVTYGIPLGNFSTIVYLVILVAALAIGGLALIARKFRGDK